jgi:acyl-CoA thioesterase-1
MLVPFVLEGVALDPRLNQADGMHPNPAGEQVIATHLLPYVQKLIAEVQSARS